MIFAKIGYLGINKIFDKNKVNYSRLTIVQASNLQKKIAVLSTTLDPNHSTTISFDAENMYPSIKYALIEKAVDYFRKNLNTDESTTIKKCLEILKFAMSSNIIAFRGKYYKYY